MAWFRIKAGSHVSKAKDGSQKITRTSLGLGYQPGDEFLESDKDLAKADPTRWEAVTRPATLRTLSKKK